MRFTQLEKEFMEYLNFNGKIMANLTNAQLNSRVLEFDLHKYNREFLEFSLIMLAHSNNIMNTIFVESIDSKFNKNPYNIKRDEDTQFNSLLELLENSSTREQMRKDFTEIFNRISEKYAKKENSEKLNSDPG